MLINRELHIAAPVSQVMTYAAQCPCPSALTLLPEGAGTRVQIRADVRPDDLAAHVEGLLIAMLHAARDQFSQEPQR